MGLLDFITGGANEDAQQQLKDAMDYVKGIYTPEAQDLQLSDLAQYESTGELSPAMIQAALAGPSAYDKERISEVPMSTLQQVLGKQMDIANANGMTPQTRAAIAEAQDAMNTSVAGQRGAIAQDFAGRGIPQSLISAALQNATVGQEAQQGYQSALQAQADAAENAQNALSNAGNTAAQMYDLQTNQANTVAAAQNALNQFNAANTQQANMANQANTQAANVYNTENKQNLANQNVYNANQQAYQNQVNSKLQAADLALQKGNAVSGIGQSAANQLTNQGQQSAGLFGGILGAGADIASSIIRKYDGGKIPRKNEIPATDFKSGGKVPGSAIIAGDSPMNDTVHAKLSPGEVVLPRSVVQNPGKIGDFLHNKVPDMAQKIATHPSDIASVIRALSILREGEK